MSEHILLAVDTHLSPTSLHALRAVSALIEHAALPASLIILHVIPFTQSTTGQPGYYVNYMQSLAPTPEQYREAEELVHTARLLAQQQGIALARSQGVVRSGFPADEIVKAAHEFQADLIVVGRHPDTLRQWFRRLLLGSVSHRVLQLASCPVMIVVEPRPLERRQVDWYKRALQEHLRKHSHELFVFTPQQAAQQFLPPDKKAVNPPELNAAEQALDYLAQKGLLCRIEVDGETRYVND